MKALLLWDIDGTLIASGGAGMRGGDARYDLDGDAGDLQRRHLLGGAAEDEGIAAAPAMNARMTVLRRARAMFSFALAIVASTRRSASGCAKPVRAETNRTR